MHVCCFLSFHWAPLRRVCLLLTPLIRNSYVSVRFLQSPLFSRLNSPNCPRLYSWERCYSSLSISVALHWLSPFCSWFSCSGSWTELSGHRTSVEQKWRITSLNLLATLHAVQDVLGARAHCWVMSSLLFTRSFSANLLSIQAAPTLVNMIILLQVEDSHFLFLNFVTFLFPHFSSLQRHTVCISHLSQFCITQMLCPTVQVINEDIKPYWSQHFTLEHTTGVWPPAQHCITDHNISSIGNMICKKQIWKKESLYKGHRQKGRKMS